MLEDEINPSKNPTNGVGRNEDALEKPKKIVKREEKHDTERKNGVLAWTAEHGGAGESVVDELVQILERWKCGCKNEI